MPHYNDYFDDYYERPIYSSYSSHRHSQSPPRTYGTYVHNGPPHNYLYTLDPTLCSCRCCPHPNRAHRRHAANPSSSSSPPSSFSSKRYKGCSDEHESSAPRTHHRNTHSRSSHRDEGYGREHSTTHQHQRDRSPRPYSSHPSSSTYRSPSTQPSSRSSKYHSSSKYPKKRSQDIEIQVKDCTTSQCLRNLYGKRFTIVLTAASRHKDIIDFLAPETNREKVVVRWPGGEYEELDELVPIADLSRQGARLEVKNRKRVHWQ